MGGTTFSIRYERERFFIKPVRGYVPCGWITYAWLEEA